MLGGGLREGHRSRNLSGSAELAAALSRQVEQSVRPNADVSRMPDWVPQSSHLTVMVSPPMRGGCHEARSGVTGQAP